jgi:hypothetical protein
MDKKLFELKWKLNNILNNYSENLMRDINVNINKVENNIWDIKKISNMSEEEYRNIINKLNEFEGFMENIIKNIKLNEEEI